MSCLAIIPARGGSKRIPKKNIKEFLGKPIIGYSIEAAIKSELFDEVMVSTEDEDIAKIAKNYGANVPFFRSEKNADDQATTLDVLLEVLNKYKKGNKEFEIICCIYPCAPLLNSAKLVQAFSIMQKKNLDGIFPVIPFSFPVQKAIKIENSNISYLSPQYSKFRTQDLEKTFHDAGQFYFAKRDKIIDSGNIFDNMGVIELSLMEGQDIDTIEDWKLAELKYQLMYG
ncbi:pseudaminic acid cytidylyltransferase [Salegentibacter agarivorans]